MTNGINWRRIGSTRSEPRNALYRGRKPTGVTEFDLASRPPDERARFLSAAVSPRPIAWISTQSADGVANLAPFSAYTHVSADPPVVLVAVSEREDGGEKDTTRNARETEAFAINVVTEALLERLEATAAEFAPEESEFDATGVARAPCTRIDPPRVADAPVTMECVLSGSQVVGDRTLLFGEVVSVHVEDAVLTEGELDAEAVGAVGHVGRTAYTGSRGLKR